MDYAQLNYISFGTQICATIWAIFLPSVKTSLYFHRNDKLTVSSDENTASKLLWLHFKMAYSNLEVVKWSIWYSIGLCGYVQIVTYCQVLWDFIDNSEEVIWNGAVEATLTLLGTVAALGAGLLTNERLKEKGRIWTLAILTVLSGFAILLAGLTHSRLISYFGYLIFGVIYSFLITIAR